MYCPVASVKVAVVLEGPGTNIGEGICMSSRHQGYGAVYIPSSAVFSPNGSSAMAPTRIDRGTQAVASRLGN